MQRSRLARSVALMLNLLLLVAPIAAQQPSPSPTPAPQQPAQRTPPLQQQQQGAPADDDEDEVVRITANLVQLDAVVTDKDGRQVTDLKPEDFEIREDDKPQPITNFSYVTIAPSGAPASAPPARSASATIPPAIIRNLRPEQVRRTIALVVDDLGLSYQSMSYVRKALRKFVDEQMQPNDLVAIIRTSAGMGALQQFTTDKRMLHSVIERIRWFPLGRGGITAFAPIESEPSTREAGAAGGGGNASESEDESTGERDSAAEQNEFREELFSVGTLGALNYIVNGLKELPGRKSVVLLSEGFELVNSQGQSARLVESLRRLTDLANRASVVVYTVDPRGMQPLGLMAADSVSSLSAEQLGQRLSDRRQKLFETQAGLDYLARQTGGFSIHNTNELANNVQRILDDQNGYYLIGYRPDPETFDPAKGRAQFHNVVARVKRPGLRVRTRSGFYGFTEEEARAKEQTAEQQLVKALVSPFSTGGVRLRLTSLFGNASDSTSFVNSLLHVEPQDITLVEEADGWHKAVVDIVALSFGENGAVVDQVSRSETIRVRGSGYENFRRNGLVYVLKVPVKKPGAYQLRVAFRDATAKRVGSASQFVEVPDLTKNRLALSGIVIVNSARPASAAQPAGGGAPASDGAAPSPPQQQGASAPSQQQGASASSPQPQAGAADQQTTNSLDAALRRFHRGAAVDYFYEVYNARLDKATGRPQLQTQFRLFREGREVTASTPIAYDASRQTDMKRLRVGTRLRLPASLPPGEYVLQVVVTDLLAPEKRRTSTQWIDFEIVE